MTKEINRRKALQFLGTISALSASKLAMGFPSSKNANSQVVLITGSSSGFGRSMALAFARAGYIVYASMRNMNSNNKTVADEFRRIANEESIELVPIQLDVTSPLQAQTAVDQVISERGKIDILINNAGIIVYAPMEVIPRQAWELQMKTNVYAPMELAGLVLPNMRSRGEGLIIQISSRVGRITLPGLGLYSSSKFAVEAAVEAAYYEATTQGIDFAIIQPSAFDTEVNRNARKIYQEFTKSLFEQERPEGFKHFRDYLENLDRGFSGQPSRSPEELAKLALDIVGTKSSHRVLRYTIGDRWELDDVDLINQVCAGAQKTALEQSGVAHWYRN